jgi:hypothetical protein
MRLAAQAKGGYYAAAPEAVRLVAERLVPPSTSDGPCTLLDPCAGEGHAATELARCLTSPEGIAAVPCLVELDERRAEACHRAIKAHGKGKVLAPADFLRAKITPGCFSLAWVNPPFDYATGGRGRVELGFVDAVLPLLAENGVLVLVCPESVAESHGCLRMIATWLDEPMCMDFPEGHRPYNEVAVIGRRRQRPASYPSTWGLWGKLRDPDRWPGSYQLPAGRLPGEWRKTEPTDEELHRMLSGSSIRHTIGNDHAAIFSPGCGSTNQEMRPPIPPGEGHRAMLLASGLIGGLIRPADEPPHVIRGSAFKESVHAGTEVEDDGQGNTITRTTHRERIKLMIRTVDAAGEMTTLLQE